MCMLARAADDRPSPRRKPPRWAMLAALAWLGVAGCMLVALVALVWRDDLADAAGLRLAGHYLAFMSQVFVFHAGIAGIVAAGFALWARRRRLLLASAASSALALAPALMPGIMPGRTLALFSGARAGAPAASAAPSLSIMSINLMYGRLDADAFLAQVVRESPDVIVLQEWTPQAASALGVALRERWPHAAEHPRSDAFGQAVFSRIPFLERPKDFPPAAGFREPQITATVDLGGSPLRVCNVHLLPPVSMGYFREQRRQALALARWCAEPDAALRPHLLIGDFNATPLTGLLRALRQVGYREAHALAGSGRGSTWPDSGVLALFPGIRLDNALAHPRLRVLQARVGESNGSDHRPVVVRVAWSPDAPN